MQDGKTAEKHIYIYVRPLSYLIFICLPILHLVVALLSPAVVPQSHTEILDFSSTSHLPHIATTLLAGITLTENQLLPTAFRV